jgi:hypothetical protein
MNQEVKAKWIAALRSGKYKQGHHFLARKKADEKDFSYCCLGVLCEILNTPFQVEDCEGVSGRAQVGEQIKAYNNHTALLPKQAAEAAGFPVALWGPKTSRGDFPTLNDELELSFDEIADIIEKEL